MNTYEQKIYEFFATEDNFRNMYKIAGHYSLVKKQLLEEFWTLVKGSLEKINEQHSNKWVVQLTGGIERDWSKLMLFKKGWSCEKGLPIVAISFQRMGVENWPFYGIFLNNDIKTFDHDAIRTRAQALPAAIGFATNDNLWWPFWKNTGLDFSKPEDFMRILPEVRNTFANDLADILFQLAEDMEAEMDKMANMVKE